MTFSSFGLNTEKISVKGVLLHQHPSGYHKKIHHPLAGALRNPHNFGMALQLGKDLLAQSRGDLGIDTRVLDVGVTEPVSDTGEVRAAASMMARFPASGAP